MLEVLLRGILVWNAKFLKQIPIKRYICLRSQTVTGKQKETKGRLPLPGGCLFEAFTACDETLRSF